MARDVVIKVYQGGVYKNFEWFLLCNHCNLNMRRVDVFSYYWLSSQVHWVVERQLSSEP